MWLLFYSGVDLLCCFSTEILKNIQLEWMEVGWMEVSTAPSY